MKRNLLSTILVLTTLSVIFMLFVYQCHPSETRSQNIEEPERNTPPVRLDDIKEGTLVKKVNESGLYEILPQLETTVQINIEGMVASTTVDQVFTNLSKEPIEAVYVFPLPQNAAVHDMKMLINDRLIQGLIKEKKEAKKTYEKAKQEGKRASLTEQERPNIFTNSVANIMPGDTIIIRLQYVEQLSYHEGSFQLRFPMVVAPRYIPGYEIKGYSGSGWAYDTDLVPDASRITPPVIPPGMRSGNTVSLKVNINAGIPVSSVSSMSHDINIIQVNDSAYQVNLKKEKVIPNKDFVLEYRIKPGKEPQAALFAATKGDDNYFMLMAVPPVNAGKYLSMKKEIIFVLDISGSMSGTSIEQAKSGLINALNLLSREDYFNIIAFNNRYEAFTPFPVKASTAGVMKGINYVNRLNAGGGTEAQPALRHALNMTHQPDTMKMIIFITDGAVGNEDQLLTLVNQDIGNSRLFTVGIGSAPNGYLLEKVSQFGRGTFTYISNISEVESKVSELFLKIEKPVLTDLSLDIAKEAEVFPDPVPDLFAGQPLVVFGKADELFSTSTKLLGKTPDGYFELDLPLDLNTATVEPAIPTLWARSKIANLMDEYRLGNGEVKQEIIDLAIEHRLITKFTSFVAVEHRIVNLKGKSRLTAIPTELPEGWEYEKVFGEEGLARPDYLPQTASRAPIIALIGFILITMGAFMFKVFIKSKYKAKQKIRVI